MNRPRRRTTTAARPLTILALFLSLGLVAAGCGQGGNVSVVDVRSQTPAPQQPDTEGPRIDGIPDVVATVASDLATPWGIDFLPDGSAVVTERDSARVLLVTPPPVGRKPTSEQGTVVELGRIPQTDPRGEAGLLGVAVSPTYAEDRFVYFYVCTQEDNRVVRATVDGTELGEPEPVLTGIPGGAIHDGGRMMFGHDGFLYVSTGEAGDEDLARDKESLAGKILRITTEGEPAPGNPFDDEVWSWGHRNVQGLALDADGSLWATEFGEDEADELNRILPGEDYGWPEVEGFGGEDDYTDPQITWSPDDASPSGMAYSDGYLWIAALQGERLWRVKAIDGQASDPAAYFGPKDGEASTYGRLRTVVRAPDGRLWLTTSNEDGRGEPAERDDRILLIDP